MFGMSECATEAVSATLWILAAGFVLTWPAGWFGTWLGRRQVRMEAERREEEARKTGVQYTVTGNLPPGTRVE